MLLNWCVDFLTTSEGSIVDYFCVFVLYIYGEYSIINSLVPDASNMIAFTCLVLAGGVYLISNKLGEINAYCIALIVFVVALSNNDMLSGELIHLPLLFAYVPMFIMVGHDFIISKLRTKFFS